MASKPTVVKRKVSELKESFYVRTTLDDDNTQKLIDLYVAGVNLPPIEISYNNIVVDGRHRLAAQKYMDREEIDCIVIAEHNMVDIIAHALNANEGGPKGMTRGDIQNTIQLMLQHGAKDKKIYDLLPYPPSMTRDLLDRAKQNMSRHRLTEAKLAVANQGLSVQQAAIKFKVDEVRLRREVAGKRIGVGNVGLAAMRASIRNRFSSLRRSNQAMVKRLVESYIDREVDETTVDKILQHIDALLRKENIALNDWKNRMAAAKNGRLINWEEMTDLAAVVPPKETKEKAEAA